MNPVAFVDTETLALDADFQPVWEVGLILPGGSEHEWLVRVTPREISLARPCSRRWAEREQRSD